MTNKSSLQYWHQLSKIEKISIFNDVSAAVNLQSTAVEKDWWVVQTLNLIYKSSIAAHTVFKGIRGGSLPFDTLMQRIKELNLRINQLKNQSRL